MVKFAVGFVLGIIVGQIGFQGLVRLLDHGVNQVQEQAQAISK